MGSQRKRLNRVIVMWRVVFLRFQPGGKNITPKYKAWRPTFTISQGALFCYRGWEGGITLFQGELFWSPGWQRGSKRRRRRRRKKCNEHARIFGNHSASFPRANVSWRRLKKHSLPPLPCLSVFSNYPVQPATDRDHVRPSWTIEPPPINTNLNLSAARDFRIRHQFPAQCPFPNAQFPAH